jgi:transcriptional regulator NrdR family protein
MKRLDSPDCACPPGKGSMVVETRMDSRYGFAWRRRLCLGCGDSFATYEIPVTSLEMDDFPPINPNGKLDRK